MIPRTSFNTKRRLRPPPSSPAEQTVLDYLAAVVRYGGNPEHKRNPGNFGLSPPSQPKVDKTLCDEAGIFDRATAERLLKEGLRRGVVSTQVRDQWPQNVWAVFNNDVVLEAELENRGAGTYHGYPMPRHDPLHKEILVRWSGS